MEFAQLEDEDLRDSHASSSQVDFQVLSVQASLVEYCQEPETHLELEILLEDAVDSLLHLILCTYKQKVDLAEVVAVAGVGAVERGSE